MKSLINAILLITISIGILSFKGSDDIDYNHNRIHKTLKKQFGSEYSLSEIEIPDSLSFKYSVNGKIFSVNTKDTNVFLWVGRVNSCRNNGCEIPSDSNNRTSFEHFDKLILYSAEKKVQLVKVYEYKATHGQEVCSKGWLKQYKGYSDGSLLRYEKEIDAISGATISARNLTETVRDVTSIINRLDTN